MSYGIEGYAYPEDDEIYVIVKDRDKDTKIPGVMSFETFGKFVKHNVDQMTYISFDFEVDGELEYMDEETCE